MTARLSRPTQRLAPARPTAPRGAHIHLAARPSDQKALARVSTRQARARCTATGWASAPASLGRVPPQPARPGAAPGPPAARGPALPVVCGGSPPRPTVTPTRSDPPHRHGHPDPL